MPVRVGVNKFESEELITIRAFKGNPEEEEKQKARLSALKKKRNNRAVTQSLRHISERAKANENLVLPILGAVKDYATIGEICGALRDIWGDWNAKPSLKM